MINKLELIQWIAEGLNVLLRKLVAEATAILGDEDTASDLVYGIINLDEAIAEALA